MAKILFAWELGGDYGHLSRLVPVACELVVRGHQCVFVVRDLTGAEVLLEPHHLAAFQAPVWLATVTNLPEPISYPEMLMRFGFLHARALTGMARAWRNLVDVIKPDLLLLDHAPTALLATRGLNIPRVNFGDGFCIPPASHPIPPFHWWQREDMARLVNSEQQALTVANDALRALNAPLMSNLGELMACDDSLFCTFAEFDHYPNRVAENYLGPIFSLGQKEDVTWPVSNGPKIFAYLKMGYAGLDTLLAALNSLQASVLVHAPGIPRNSVQQFTSEKMTFSIQPLNMDQVAASCDLALCHGGGGTTAALLLAGKPLILFPMHLEQAMTARRLIALGVAVSLAPQECAHLPQLMRKMLSDPTLTHAAQKFAVAHKNYCQRDTVRLAADRCEALLTTHAAH